MKSQAQEVWEALRGRCGWSWDQLEQFGGLGVCVTVSQPGLTAVSPADTQSPRPAFPGLA